MERVYIIEGLQPFRCSPFRDVNIDIASKEQNWCLLESDKTTAWVHFM